MADYACDFTLARQNVRHSSEIHIKPDNVYIAQVTNQTTNLLTNESTNQ
jgi:hypothetical protein